MKKMFLAFLLVAAPALLVAVPARAQQLATDAVVVKVPFRFVVGSEVLPAGRYDLRAETMDPSVIWIEGANGRSVAVTNMLWGGRAFKGHQADLAFKVYGHTHFLSRINIPGDDSRVLPVTRADVAQELVRLAEMRADRRNG